VVWQLKFGLIAFGHAYGFLSDLRAVVLNRGGAPLLNVTPVLILRRYVLFGLVPAEMEVGVKYLEILQADSSLHANIQGRN